MASKKHRPEEAVAKLRQVDVLVSQGQSVAEAIRAIGVTEVADQRGFRRLLPVEYRPLVLLDLPPSRRQVEFGGGVEPTTLALRPVPRPGHVHDDAVVARRGEPQDQHRIAPRQHRFAQRQRRWRGGRGGRRRFIAHRRQLACRRR